MGSGTTSPALDAKGRVRSEWLRPGSVEERLYQDKILETARLKNTLVVLPTALGKTVIALLLAIEKAKDGKVFFLAPTRPLVEQHHRTFREKTTIDERELALVTGRSPPSVRETLYRSGIVVFATPQCVCNDLKSGVLSLEDASLVVFDEAHRARGDYAYVGIAHDYLALCPKPLVLGLTASPGGREEQIMEVCRNLGVETVEFRVDDDEDVAPYIQPIEIDWRRVKPPQAYIQLRDRLRAMLIERIKGLQSLGALRGRRPEVVTRRDLVGLNEELQRRLGNGEGGYLYQVKVLATTALSLTHMVELIETQGPETLEAFVQNSLKRMASQGSRGHKSIVSDPSFLEVEERLASCMGVENPKAEELTRTLGGQFEANPASRMIVFTQYRDTVNAILRRLAETPGIRAARFVGQGLKDGEPGMTQEQQHEALERLRGGELNALVATSIAEEGLDIPEVDHVVFYEPVPSEIRYIQRRGRTGRRVAGKVSILIAEDTIDEAFYWSSMNKARKMRRIIQDMNWKLAQVLKKEPKPQSTLTPHLASKPMWTTRVSATPVRTALNRRRAASSPAKMKLWVPETMQTRGSSTALKWLMENLPEESTSIEELVREGVRETGAEKATVETALWRMTQQGLLYQPQPGKIRRL